MMNDLSGTRRRGGVIRLAAVISVLVLVAAIVVACATQVQPSTGGSETAPAAATEASADTGTDTGTDTTDASAGAEAEAEAEPEEAAGDATAPTAPPAANISGAAALPSDETYNGIPVGFTEDGFLYRGEPDAPVIMVEYSDYGCPFCNRYFVQTEPALNEAYVRRGELRVVFHDFPIASLHPNAPAAHQASLCVADQGSAERYWMIHAELFRTVDQWSGAADPLPILAQVVEGVGADMDAYAACMEAGEKEQVVQERVNAAAARGFNGTPSFQFVRSADNTIFELVGAQPYDQFAGIVDAVLAGETPQTAQAAGGDAQPEQGIPFWATTEGWQPDPERPGYNIAGDQYRGEVDAPLTVIEFSDFQCPYCKRHVDETQPALDENYIDTGKVLWVFKHFPLTIHPQAPAAGVAAECAAEQGAFWEMHDLLFSNPQAWSIEAPNPIFVEYAGELELDAEAFSTCLDDPAMAERVQEDLNAGAAYVRGTPTFIIIRGEQGSIIPGALPVESFTQVLDDELEAAGVN